MTKPKQVIAEIMDRIVDRPGHNMLAHEIVKKLEAAGYVIVPIKPSDEMLEELARIGYQKARDVWVGLRQLRRAIDEGEDLTSIRRRVNELVGQAGYHVGQLAPRSANT